MASYWNLVNIKNIFFVKELMIRSLFLSIALLIVGCEAKKEPERLKENPLRDYVETPLNSAKELNKKVGDHNNANLIDDTEEDEEKGDQEIE